MNRSSLFRHSALVLSAALLGACSLTQSPAPVLSGSTGGTDSNTPYTPPAADTSNPYGAQPYTPPADSQSTTPYTPPATTSGSGYVPSYAPVDINAATHTVVRGDTVYNISRRYQISQDNLRAWNNLADNNIGVGQILRVKPAGYTPPATSQPAQTTPPPVVQPPVQQTPPTQQQPAQQTPAANTPAPGATRSVAGITWQRPTAGSVLTRFGGAQKGINIGGNLGQPVVAAADGKVVYSGSGLRGYGNLIIIQHNQTYLTAYGHNQRLLVQEGQTVRRGQSIATMGNSDTSRVQLHFELRKDGQPVDPLQYVPN